jgi:hypothetical protein
LGDGSAAGEFAVGELGVEQGYALGADLKRGAEKVAEVFSHLAALVLRHPRSVLVVEVIAVDDGRPNKLAAHAVASTADDGRSSPLDEVSWAFRLAERAGEPPCRPRRAQVQVVERQIAGRRAHRGRPAGLGMDGEHQARVSHGARPGGERRALRTDSHLPRRGSRHEQLDEDGHGATAEADVVESCGRSGKLVAGGSARPGSPIVVRQEGLFLRFVGGKAGRAAASGPVATIAETDRDRCGGRSPPGCRRRHQVGVDRAVLAYGDPEMPGTVHGERRVEQRVGFGRRRIAEPAGQLQQVAALGRRTARGRVDTFEVREQGRQGAVRGGPKLVGARGGALLGGASLDAERFAAIVAAGRR